MRLASPCRAAVGTLALITLSLDRQGLGAQRMNFRRGAIKQGGAMIAKQVRTMEMGRTAAFFIILAIAALGLALAVSSGAVNASVPNQGGPPHVFLGSAIINGNPAPEGTIVAALIDGVTVSTVEVDASGRYVNLQVSTAGTAVTFTIGGLPAAETATSERGGLGILNLTAIGAAQPADTPVPPTAPPAPPAPADTPVPPTAVPAPADTPVPPTAAPAPADTPVPPTAAPAPEQQGDSSGSCGSSPDRSFSHGAGDMALLILPLLGLVGWAGLRRKRRGSLDVGKMYLSVSGKRGSGDSRAEIHGPTWTRRELDPGSGAA